MIGWSPGPYGGFFASLCVGNTIFFLFDWFGLASFYPAEHLLRPGAAGAMAFAGIPMAAVMFFVAYRVWQFGLRHHDGTGM